MTQKKPYPKTGRDPRSGANKPTQPGVKYTHPVKPEVTQPGVRVVPVKVEYGYQCIYCELWYTKEDDALKCYFSHKATYAVGMVISFKRLPTVRIVEIKESTVGGRHRYLVLVEYHPGLYQIREVSEAELDRGTIETVTDDITPASDYSKMRPIRLLMGNQFEMVTFTETNLYSINGKRLVLIHNSERSLRLYAEYEAIINAMNARYSAKFRRGHTFRAKESILFGSQSKDTIQLTISETVDVYNLSGTQTYKCYDEHLFVCYVSEQLIEASK